MLLKRIANALRRQDWLPVLIEFLIVVVGIFVGLQVSNWNEERVFANQERAFLAQLHDEIDGNLRSLAYREAFTRRVVDGGEAALDWIDERSDCEPFCAERLVDLFHASQVWGTAHSTATAEELQRIGLPRDLSLRERIRPYYQYLSGWETVNQTPPPFRERFRGHLDPGLADLLWRDCYRINEGQVEILTHDCTEAVRMHPGLSDTVARIIGDDDLPDLLRFWLVQNIYALIHYPEMAAHGRAAMASIAHAVERDPAAGD
ncbi:hypothetical protein [Halomonas denitrificans]|nr:hypothetical protein [Halomonas denitrificans]